MRDKFLKSARIQGVFNYLQANGSSHLYIMLLAQQHT